MTMHKMVNGVAVDLTPSEEAATLAEWDANDPEKLPPRAPTNGFVTHDQLEAALTAAGISAVKVTAAMTAIQAEK